MFFIIVRDINGFVRPYGFLNNRSGVGISVANASDASVSIIRFTHNICTALKKFKLELGLKFVDVQIPSMVNPVQHKHQ